MKKNLSFFCAFFFVATINAMSSQRSLDSLQDAKSGYEAKIGLMKSAFARRDYNMVSMFCSEISAYFQQKANEAVDRKLKEEYQKIAQSFMERSLRVADRFRPMTFEAFLYASLA
jgi:uncharacterized membrane protein YcgQ (UPF0703/DUF1980 family)